MSKVSIILNKKLTHKQKEVLETFKEFQEAMISKDFQKLNDIIGENYTLTHMSGKTQTKTEYINEIMDGTLNYYKSTIINPKITFNDENHATLLADVELNAKVYGIKGTWTLNTNIEMKKKENKWIMDNWKT